MQSGVQMRKLPEPAASRHAAARPARKRGHHHHHHHRSRAALSARPRPWRQWRQVSAVRLALHPQPAVRPHNPCTDHHCCHTTAALCRLWPRQAHRACSCCSASCSSLYSAEIQHAWAEAATLRPQAEAAAGGGRRDAQRHAQPHGLRLHGIAAGAPGLAAAAAAAAPLAAASSAVAPAGAARAARAAAAAAAAVWGGLCAARCAQGDAAPRIPAA